MTLETLEIMIELNVILLSKVQLSRSVINIFISIIIIMLSNAGYRN